MTVVDRRPVRRVERSRDAEYDERRWPYSVPAVAQLLSGGLDMSSGVTVLVGENGSGKSTLVEAIAGAYGLNPEGGSAGAQHSTRVSESDLARSLTVSRGPGAARWGFFLRAETMHGFYTYLEANPSTRRPDPEFHEMSHGESFLALLGARFDSPGFYCLDEPESALSFTGCLALVGVLYEITTGGGQALVATHSPIIAAVPGARILEVGAWGLREVTWDELELVNHWRRFLSYPDSYLRHIVHR